MLVEPFWMGYWQGWVGEGRTTEEHRGRACDVNNVLVGLLCRETRSHGLAGGGGSEEVHGMGMLLVCWVENDGVLAPTGVTVSRLGDRTWKWYLRVLLFLEKSRNDPCPSRIWSESNKQISLLHTLGVFRTDFMCISVGLFVILSFKDRDSVSFALQLSQSWTHWF